LSLRRNTYYNLLGSALPALTALVTIPWLLGEIGNLRFGVFSIVWLLLGHFAVFDFGLSRATANRIAKLGSEEHSARRELLWTAIWLNVGFGLTGAVVLYFLVEPLVTHIFGIEEPVRREVLGVAGWIAAAVPLMTVAGVLGGALDGRERFDVANTLQALSGALIQIVPAVVASAFSPELSSIIPATVLARAFSVALLLIAVLRVVAPGAPTPPNGDCARSLFTYGVWISISALIIPFFVTLDKFVIGALLGAAAVAYYAVPDQLVRRISAAPAAFARALFTRMSAAQELRMSRELADQSARLLASIVTPAVVALILLMDALLTVWISPSFAAVAAAPGIILAVGIWLNSLAMIPSAYLQAIGRPNATARAHMIEIVPHIVVMAACVHFFGLIGAATAELFVTALDATLLMVYSGMLLWRTAYFRMGAVWLVVAAAWGLRGDAEGPYLYYSVAAVVVLASAVWALRISPEIITTGLSLLRSAMAGRARGASE
jgi:O-antigen/teichoic acid export membrane protein